jgi:hypothetical protein
MNSLGRSETDQILKLTSHRLKQDFNKLFQVLKTTEIIYVAPKGAATAVSDENETADFYNRKKMYSDPMRSPRFE